jgi:hypothetical protein
MCAIPMLGVLDAIILLECFERVWRDVGEASGASCDVPGWVERRRVGRSWSSGDCSYRRCVSNEKFTFGFLNLVLGSIKELWAERRLSTAKPKLTYIVVGKR